MKYLFIITGLLISLSTAPQALATNTGSNLTFPKTLKCESIQFLQGLENFKDPSIYFPAFLTEISHESATLSSGQQAKVLGQVRSGHGLVRFDFSDGDQYSFYDFYQKELIDLADGIVSEIEGTYEDGFDWNNKFNIRAMFRLKCIK
ncbi:MAG: hypothetical protein ABIQ95_04460 [Bdellovibrionia bacterium]